MKRYVILKKFGYNEWYTTQRYTKSEVITIVDRLFGVAVDFDEVNLGGCSKLSDGVIVMLAEKVNKLSQSTMLYYLDDNLNKVYNKVGIVIYAMVTLAINTLLFGWIGILVAVFMEILGLEFGKQTIAYNNKDLRG